MQKAETSLIPDISKPKPKIAKLIDIAVDETNMVYVNWPTDKRELCLTALCEALKLVASYKVEEKPKPSLIDFIRGVKH